MVTGWLAHACTSEIDSLRNAHAVGPIHPGSFIRSHARIDVVCAPLEQRPNDRLSIWPRPVSCAARGAAAYLHGADGPAGGTSENRGHEHDANW